MSTTYRIAWGLFVCVAMGFCMPAGGADKPTGVSEESYSNLMVNEVLDLQDLAQGAGNPLRRTESGLGVTNSFNNLNQIVSGVWTGGAVTVAGAVNYNTGTVTVNGAVAERHGLFYERTNVTLSAGTNILTAVYRGPAFTNTAMVATSIAEVVVGATAYGHDANGNLTNDANFACQYDAQNRLTNVVRKADGISVLANRYDGTGRRVEAIRETGTERYVYFPGSFLMLAVLDGSNSVKEVFTHGPDLSGALGGAGGIGGILAQTAGTAGPDTHYLHPDAMGNIVLTTDASGQTSSTVHYGPFGRILARAGEFQGRYLFSSKEWEAEAGLSYYGYRFYSSQQGRWISRDPLEERGGNNLYGFVYNEPFSSYDEYGLQRGGGGNRQNRFAELTPSAARSDSMYRFSQRYTRAQIETLKNLVNDTQSIRGSDRSSIRSFCREANQLINKFEDPSISDANPSRATIERELQEFVNYQRLASELIWRGTRINQQCPVARGAIPAKLYHYTGVRNVAGVLEGGLRPGASGQVFTTPNGGLSPLQARNQLALQPERGMPGSVLEIDAAALNLAGIQPILGPVLVRPTDTASGGGFEVVFGERIPPEFIRQVR